MFNTFIRKFYADNVELNVGSGGKTIATDDIAGIQHELVKVEFGSDGTATQVDAANPLPVTDAVSEAALNSIAAEDFATHAAQVDNSQKTQLVDAAGNQVTVTGNKLDVNVFSGDIEIGAVELKNGTDDTRAIVTPANALKVDGSAVTQPVSAAALPLPAGAATAANQQTDALTDAQIRATALPVSGTFFQATQPVSAAALPLPSGASTEATLALIKAKTDNIDVALSTRTKPSDQQHVIIDSGGGGATTIADGADVAEGAIADAIVAAGAAGTVSAKLRRVTQGLEDLKAGITALPLPTGAATGAKQDTGNTSLASILAKIIAAPSTEAKQDTIITALATLLTISDFDTKTGSLTETAPATDTASSGLNGRLQRIAQRLTSLITALGSPFQAGGSIGNTSFASTVADAANVVEGALADAIVAAGATGSISAKLRRATQGLEDLKTLIVLAAGSAIIGKVGIDQTTPGTTNAVAATGNVAHDAVDSGNPVKVGQKAVALGSNPAAVAAGDRTDWYANTAGIPFVQAGHPNVICFRATYTAAQTDTAIITISTGSKIVVTRLTVTASAANTVNPSVIIGFGTANTPTTTGVVLSHPGIAPGSGVVEGNGAGILGIGADNEDLRITASVPTSGAIDVVVSYYTVAT